MNSARIGTALVPTCGLVVSMPSMMKRFSEPDAAVDRNAARLRFVRGAGRLSRPRR